MAEMGHISETDLAALETGEHAEDAQQDTTEKTPAEKPATETASDEAQAGEVSEEEKQAAREAEEAAERERITRESTPGTPEFYQAQAKRAKESKKKLAIDLNKEREERIRAEEREKVLRDLVDKGVVGKGGEKTAPADADPKPVHPKMKDFESQEEYEVAVEQFHENRFAWENRERGRQQRVAQDTQSVEYQRRAEIDRQLAPFNRRRDEIGQEIVKSFGKEALAEVQQGLKLPIGSPMVSAIFESKHAAQIMHYLVENDGVEEKILGMGLRAQVAEIDKIERLVTAKPVPREPKAPAPVGAVKAGATVPGEIPDDMEALERVLKKN